ncbi:hypothetical protein, partial [Actinacidiphila oryziradicis]|uniref:hypothetical protein n=1 Tax=Actinacidiphila oryziradicis TaxID=2571141 RepID=UPI001B801801
MCSGTGQGTPYNTSPTGLARRRERRDHRESGAERLRDEGRGALPRRQRRVVVHAHLAKSVPGRVEHPAVADVEREQR